MGLFPHGTYSYSLKEQTRSGLKSHFCHSVTGWLGLVKSQRLHSIGEEMSQGTAVVLSQVSAFA